MLLFVLLSFLGCGFGQLTKPCSQYTGPVRGGNFTIDVGGTPRNYLLYIPPRCHNNTVPCPLMLTFHGHGLDASDQFIATSLNDSTVNPDYVTASLQGLPGQGGPRIFAWQGAPYAAPGVNDTGFVTEVLDRFENQLCLNKTQYFASGFSNGGGFVNTLACTPPINTRFAAFNVDSGAIYAGSEGIANPSGNCEPRDGRTPIMEIHGGADQTIPYIGSQSYEKPPNRLAYPSILRYVKQWATRNNCTQPIIDVTIHNGTVIHYYYSNHCGTQHYDVVYMQHDWAHKGNPNITISTTTKFLLFDDHHPLR